MSRPIATADLAASLGPDLAALVQERRVPLVKATELTVLRPQRLARSSFLLEFADGTRLKGRRLNRPSSASRVASLLDELADGFPRLVARRGDALLLEWIEGTVLSSQEPLAADMVRRCGALLGALHARQAAPPTDEAAEILARAHAELEVWAQPLERDGLLSPDLARRAFATAAEHRPPAASIGIIHRDLCPENIVEDTAGALVCIDNALLTIGPHDLDLARTFYRWPMSAEQRTAFETGYQEHRSLADFDRHGVYWTVVVLISVAGFRHSFGLPRAPEILARLEAVTAAAAQGGERPDGERRP